MLDLASHALALVSSYDHSRGRIIDRISRPGDLVDWLDARGLTEPAGRLGLTLPDRRRAHEHALRLRGALRGLLSARSAGREPRDEDLFVVNRVLAASTTTDRLDVRDGGFVHERDEASADPLAVLAPIGRGGISLLTEVDPKRLRECAAPDCRTWFVDTSKGGRRRWCSMSTCGNRQKAARHRRRAGERTEP